MRHNRLWLTLALILALTLSAILPGGALAEERAEKDEIVVLFGNASFASLDPQTHAGTILGGVLGNIYETLVKRASDGTYQPVLATEWSQIEPTVWEFKLREGVSFHNGEPLNAEAVKFTVERAKRPEINALNAHNFTTIESVEAVDELTVRIHTTVEDPLLVSRMASWPMSIVPPAYCAEVGDDEFALKPIGTGPYRFVSYQADQDLIFEANDEYWGGKPAVRKVRWRVVPESGSRMAELQAGTADIVDNVPYDQIDRLNEQEGISVKSSMGIRTVYLQLDCEVEPTNDKAVRQAIAYSIDVDSIINDLLMGNGRRIATYSVPEVAYHNPDLAPYPYDVEKARQLLTDAGYADQLPLKLTFDVTVGRVPMDKEVCEVIGAMLNETGLFEVNVIINEAGVYNEKYNKKELPRTIGQIIMSTHGNYTYDPDFTLTRSFRSVPEPRTIIASHQKHPEWDELIDKAGVSTNDEERKELYYQLQEMIFEDCPRVYLYQQRITWGVSDSINWEPDGEMVNVFDISGK